jgi:hypothetical protein
MTDEVTSATDKIPGACMTNETSNNYVAVKLGLEKGKEIGKFLALIQFKCFTLAPAVKELLDQCSEIQRQLMLERLRFTCGGI